MHASLQAAATAATAAPPPFHNAAAAAALESGAGAGSGCPLVGSSSRCAGATSGGGSHDAATATITISGGPRGYAAGKSGGSIGGDSFVGGGSQSTALRGWLLWHGARAARPSALERAGVRDCAAAPAVPPSLLGMAGEKEGAAPCSSRDSSAHHEALATPGAATAAAATSLAPFPRTSRPSPPPPPQRVRPASVPCTGTAECGCERGRGDASTAENGQICQQRVCK